MQSEQREMQEAYQAVAAIDSRYQTALARQRGMRETLPKLEGAAAGAAAGLRETLVSYARGVASDQDVAEARAAVADANATLGDSIATLSILDGPDGVARVAEELIAAKARAAQARQRYTNNVIFAEIAASIRSDTKLRDRIDLAYAAVMSGFDPALGSGSGGVNWPVLLNECFPDPDDAMHDRAIAAFEKRYPLLSLSR